MVDALFSSSNTSATILSAIGVLRKLCNHPRLVLSCLKETSLQPSSESPADVASMNRSRLKAQFNEHFQARYEAYIYIYIYILLLISTCNSELHLSVSPYYLLEKVEMLVGIRNCCS
jgi:SNF2 family DNA or RNA helicase